MRERPVSGWLMRAAALLLFATGLALVARGKAPAAGLLLLAALAAAGLLTPETNQAAVLAFDVEQFESDVRIQSEMALREVAGSHRYGAVEHARGRMVEGALGMISGALGRMEAEHAGAMAPAERAP